MHGITSFNLFYGKYVLPFYLFYGKYVHVPLNTNTKLNNKHKLSILLTNELHGLVLLKLLKKSDNLSLRIRKKFLKTRNYYFLLKIISRKNRIFLKKKIIMGRKLSRSFFKKNYFFTNTRKLNSVRKSDNIYNFFQRKNLTSFLGTKSVYYSVNKKYAVPVLLTKVNPVNSLIIFLFFIKNPFFLKLNTLNENMYISNNFSKYLTLNLCGRLKNLKHSNVTPTNNFSIIFFKKINNSIVFNKLKPELIPWYYHNIIRFIEFSSGKKALLQYYPFMSQEVEMFYIVKYKLWLPRMAYYERKLGHRFFLEEAVHILHLGFTLRDPVIISS